MSPVTRLWGVGGWGWGVIELKHGLQLTSLTSWWLDGTLCLVRGLYLSKIKANSPLAAIITSPCLTSAVLMCCRRCPAFLLPWDEDGEEVQQLQHPPNSHLGELWLATQYTTRTHTNTFRCRDSTIPIAFTMRQKCKLGNWDIELRLEVVTLVVQFIEIKTCISVQTITKNGQHCWLFEV